MKKCPVCEKEFDDNLRFCQVDGTPLVEKVDEAPPPDPYKTMVARKEDIAAAIPKDIPPSPSVVPPIPSPLEDQLLEMPPANDPNKTQFVSEAELRAEMEAHSENQVIDVPPATESAASDIPITGDPNMAPPAERVSDPPPSPFSPPSSDEPGPANFPTSPPIPSPFNASPEPRSSEPEAPSPQFAEPAAPSPFDPPAQAAPMAQAEFNSPSIPEPNMQNPQNFGQQPYNPPASGGGQNSTLAIISLICGILGMTVCCGSFVVSLVAVVLGFMARGKASSDPGSYGGAGLALGGIITGAIGLLGSLIVIVLYFFGFAASMMQNM